MCLTKRWVLTQCINAFSLTSLPDLAVVNFDAGKMKSALTQGADLFGRLMRTDWSSASENSPVCDPSQPVAHCGDFGESDCYIGTSANTMKHGVDWDFQCQWEGQFNIATGDYLHDDFGQALGTCTTVENYLSTFDDPLYTCQGACASAGLAAGYDTYEMHAQQSYKRCQSACETAYTSCVHFIGSHEEIIDRDASDEINHQVLSRCAFRSTLSLCFPVRCAYLPVTRVVCLRLDVPVQPA